MEALDFQGRSELLKEHVRTIVVRGLRSQVKYSLALLCEGSAPDGAPHIADRDGNPNVFKLERNTNGLWLNKNWAKPDNRWHPHNQFAFRLRRSTKSAERIGAGQASKKEA